MINSTPVAEPVVLDNIFMTPVSTPLFDNVLFKGYIEPDDITTRPKGNFWDPTKHPISNPVPNPADTSVYSNTGRIYTPSPKHATNAKGRSAWDEASIDIVPDIKVGQFLIDTAFESTDPLHMKDRIKFNFYKGQVIAFRGDSHNVWHSYVISGKDRSLPNDVVKNFEKSGLSLERKQNG